MDKRIAIHERFTTFQGEGVHLGRKAFFIRTMGCPVKCEWCDSAGTWHPDYQPENLNRMTVKELVVEAVLARPSIVVITGGEPMVQPNLPYLCHGLKAMGFPHHIETCGAFYQPDMDNRELGEGHEVASWFTVSPKRAHLPVPEMLEMANELKIIVDTPFAIAEWVETLTRIMSKELHELAIPVWLHPEWSQRDNPAILNAITKVVVDDPRGIFRAGWQMHKLYRADALDHRSAPTVPLGGNPELGSAT
jgi:organic radical activating enzyme